MIELRVAVLGAGVVGAEVLRLLSAWSEDLEHRCGARLRVCGIAVSHPHKKRPAWVDPELLTTDAGALVADADIVVELMGGIEPARTLIAQALEHGASVVTANKALMARHGSELFSRAEAHEVDLYYEASVAGAVPVVYALRESLAGDAVTRVVGIVNGTTNFILDEMARRGVDFEDALADAQRLGYAEADPSADVDGLDAAAKAALLASLAFHSRVTIDDVDCTGIRDVTAADIAAAREAGYVLKLLATCARLDEGICVRVGPTLVPADDPLAAVHGAFNAVVVEAEAAGRLMFYGQGAGGAPTASAVLSDIVAAAGHRVAGGRAPRESAYAALPVLPADRLVRPQQVSLAVSVAPGTLARICAAFGRAGVSLATVRQEPGPACERLQLVTHPAQESDVHAVVAALRLDPSVGTVQSILPVEAT